MDTNSSNTNNNMNSYTNYSVHHQPHTTDAALNSPVAQDMQIPMSSMHSMILSTNAKIDVLASQVSLLSNILSNVDTGIDLGNKSSATLKEALESIIASQNEINRHAGQTNCSSTHVKVLEDSDFEPEEIYTHGSRYPKISRMIQDYIKKPNFFHSDPEKVAENNEKPGWCTNSTFKGRYNNTLAMTLILHLRLQEEAAGISSNALARIVKNHYRNQVRTVKTNLDKMKKRQTILRRRMRKKMLLKRRKMAYLHYKQDIDEMMNNVDCNAVLQEEVMSDDSSDGEKQVWAYRPSWRSDELQRFISIVDDFAVKKLKNKSRSLIKRVPRIITKPEPPLLKVPLPKWSINSE